MTEAIRPTYGAVGPRPKDLCSLLVATPKALRENISQSRLRLLRTVVLDEADLLLTGEYADDVTEWLVKGRQSRGSKSAKARNQILQTVFCGATVPDAGSSSATSFIQSNFPDATWVQAGLQHSMSERTTHKYCAIEVDEALFGDERALRIVAGTASAQGHGSGRDGQADAYAELEEGIMPAGIDPLALMAQREALLAERHDCIQAAKLRLLPALLTAASDDPIGLVGGKPSISPALGDQITALISDSESRSTVDGTVAGTSGGPATLPPSTEQAGRSVDRDEILRLSEGIVLPSVRADARRKKKGKGGRHGSNSTGIEVHLKATKLVHETTALTQLDTAGMPQTLVFCNTVASANAALQQIRSSAPHLSVAVLHKKIGAARRQAAMARFLQGDLKVLVCTDIAARGLDTNEVGHVI